MGYRSDVAYVIKFKEPEHREAFINLVKVGDDEEKKKALAEAAMLTPNAELSGAATAASKEERSDD